MPTSTEFWNDWAEWLDEAKSSRLNGQCGMQNTFRDLTSAGDMLNCTRRFMASKVYTIGQSLYPVFVELAEAALVTKDLKLFWLYSDLCDTIHVHLLERHRQPKTKGAAIPA
jgi:hypothetical protein